MRKGDPLSWMWLEAFETLERAERLHRKFFELTSTRSLGPAWEPPLDLLETTDSIFVLAALPGVEPERIEVGIQDDQLIVSGVRHLPQEYRTGSIHRLEIPHGRFERIVMLPHACCELEQKTVLNGCLILRLAKK